MGPSLPVLYLTSVVQYVQETFGMWIAPLYIEAPQANICVFACGDGWSVETEERYLFNLK